MLNRGHYALHSYARCNLMTLTPIFGSLPHPLISTMQHDAVMLSGSTPLSRDKNGHVYPLDDVALCGSMGD